MAPAGYGSMATGGTGVGERCAACSGGCIRSLARPPLRSGAPPSSSIGVAANSDRDASTEVRRVGDPKDRIHVPAGSLVRACFLESAPKAPKCHELGFERLLPRLAQLPILRHWRDAGGVKRPIVLVVLNCWVTDTKEARSGRTPPRGPSLRPRRGTSRLERRRGVTEVETEIAWRTWVTGLLPKT